MEKFIRHPKYHHFKSIGKDYGLVKLSYPINFDLPHVKIVCLPINAPDVTVGMNLTASGWGFTDPIWSNIHKEPSFSDVLKSVSIVTISNAECQTYFPTVKIVPTNVCAWGTEKASNPCTGDSGGNYLIFYFLK